MEQTRVVPKYKEKFQSAERAHYENLQQVIPVLCRCTEAVMKIHEDMRGELKKLADSRPILDGPEAMAS